MREKVVRGRRSVVSFCRCAALAFLAANLLSVPARAQDDANEAAAVAPRAAGALTGGPQEWTSPEGLSSALQVMLLLTVISLAPAVVLMTTSFIRVIVVLGLLRQALGTQQLPPSQVITGLSLFVTLVIMTPTWKQVYDEAIAPYTARQPGMTLEKTWQAGARPVRKFMSDQITRTGNDEDVRLFLEYVPKTIDPKTGEPYEYIYYGEKPGHVEVPLVALAPAFMLSELKTAFLIGFQIFLPFLILDLVVSSVTISMGMLMLSPILISLPLKILLFVLLDGWHLVVQMLLESFLGGGSSS
jgi:flagellar biosynthetic protein FliP